MSGEIMAIAKALDILYGVITIAQQAQMVATKVTTLIEVARAEGRDLTPEELQSCEDARKDSQAALEKILGISPEEKLNG